jgi:hypothetical protein
MKPVIIFALSTSIFLTCCKDDKKEIVKKDTSNSKSINNLDQKKNTNDSILKNEDENITNNEINPLIEKKFLGKYTISVETDETTNGTAIMNYEFEIFEDNIFLKIDTLHEPIKCGGQYDFKMKDGNLQLFYAGIDESCPRDYPLFEIKSERGKLFIKGIGGEGTNKLWLELLV